LIKSQHTLLKERAEKFALKFINLLILFGIRRNCPRSGRRRSLCLSIRRLIKHIIICIEAYHFCELRTKFFQYPAVKFNSHMQRKLLGIISVDFDATGQLLTIYSTFVNYLRKNGNTIKQCVSYSCTSRKLTIPLG